MRNGKLWIGTVHGISIFDGKTFSSLNNELVLKTNPVQCLLQDSASNVWIGTRNKGLFFYNGSTLTPYSKKGFEDLTINNLALDSKGNVWVGTNTGAYNYSGKLFTHLNKKNGLPSDTINKIICDTKGKVWIATTDGLFIYNNSNRKTTTRVTDFNNIDVHTLFLDKNKNVWIGTKRNLTMYNGKFNHYPISNTLNDDKISAITQDASGQIWIATQRSGFGKLVKGQLKMYYTKHGLPTNQINDIKTDREDNLWLATTNGLSKYSGDRFITYTTSDGLSVNDILSLHVSDSSHIWVGTNAGGLNKFTSSGFLRCTNEFLKATTSVYSIIKDNQNNFWFGTTNGVVTYNTLNGKYKMPLPQLSNRVVYALLESRNGNKYFGTDKGLYILADAGLKKIESEAGLNDKKVNVLVEDKNNIIWIGTQKGIYYIIGNKLVNFCRLYNLPMVPVNSISESNGNKIVFSTLGTGAFVFDSASPASGFKNITEQEGIQNRMLKFSFLDAQNNLWLASAAGLDKFNLPSFLNNKLNTIEHYNASTGFNASGINVIAADPNGDIWFGASNGLVKYNVESSKPVLITPLISLTKVQLFMQDINWKNAFDSLDKMTGLPKRLELKYNQNHISFTYQGIYLTAPQQLRYSFMLKGLEENWLPPTDRSDAYYPNIPPGEYVFKVKATADGQHWSEPTSYFFIITPPWWKTKIAYFFYAISAVALVYSFLRYRTKSLEKSKNLLSQKVIERTRELNRTNIELSKLSLVASETDNAVLIFDRNLHLEYANAGFTKITGYTIDEFIKVHSDNIFKLTFYHRLEDVLDEALLYKKSVQYESKIKRKDGSSIWTATTLTPIFNSKGDLQNVVLIDTNINTIKAIEKQLTDSFEERGLLLKEIHHRVKNNLQIIISLFNLQSSYITDANAQKALREGQNRIKSMALIHERFYQSEGLSKIDFDVYIERLADTILASYNTNSEKIKLEIDAEKISLDIDTAVPCGLIINELINNSVKHAFNESEKGLIYIKLFSLSDNECRLIIGDNGIGINEPFNFENTDTLGMQLIAALTEQIDGKLSIDHTKGLQFTIDFKKLIL